MVNYNTKIWIETVVDNLESVAFESSEIYIKWSTVTLTVTYKKKVKAINHLYKPILMKLF